MMRSNRRFAQLRLSGLAQTLDVRLQEAAGHNCQPRRVPGADPAG